MCNGPRINLTSKYIYNALTFIVLFLVLKDRAQRSDAAESSEDEEHSSFLDVVTNNVLLYALGTTLKLKDWAVGDTDTMSSTTEKGNFKKRQVFTSELALFF